MTSTAEYVESLSGLRTATEKTAELWKQGAQRLAEQAEVAAKLPQPNLTQIVESYFGYLQRTVEITGEYARQATASMVAVADTIREPTGSIATLLQAHADAAAELISGGAGLAEDVARQQADAVQKVKRSQLRRSYEGLNRAELSGQLAERNLPKTGTVQEMIDRLIEADQT